MRITEKKYRLDSWVLRMFIVFSLLFPLYYSPYTDVYQSAYYAGGSWAYLCLIIYMVIRLCLYKEKLSNSKVFLSVFVILVILYNLFSIYFNYNFLGWYWEQINNTIAFLFVIFLLCGEGSINTKGHDNISFLIHCIVISNTASIIYHLLGYSRLLICNNQFIFYKIQDAAYEERHFWIYSHKSEYALMLVAFLALFLAYKKRFKNNITFVLSCGVLMYCLYLTHSWTGVVAAVVVVAFYLADRIEWKKFKLRSWNTVAVGALAILAVFFGYKILQERNIFTLGSRTLIWKRALEVISEYPQGWGMRFGNSLIKVTDKRYVNNAHNVFLNQILRFSIPAGVCFTLIFLGIVIYMIVKGRNFMIAGTWLALLLLLDMDYSMMSINMAMVLFVAYLVMGYKKRDEEGVIPRRGKEVIQ